MRDKYWDEPDPYLREIYALGWDDVYQDRCTHKLVLVMHEPKQTKEIDLSEIGPAGQNFRVRTGILPDGRSYSWVAERDGNADRFRDLVRPTERIPQNE